MQSYHLGFDVITVQKNYRIFLFEYLARSLLKRKSTIEAFVNEIIS